MKKQRSYAMAEWAKPWWDGNGSCRYSARCFSGGRGGVNERFAAALHLWIAATMLLSMHTWLADSTDGVHCCANSHLLSPIIPD